MKECEWNDKKNLGCFFSKKLTSEKGIVTIHTFTKPIEVSLNTSMVCKNSGTKKEVEMSLRTKF